MTISAAQVNRQIPRKLSLHAVLRSLNGIWALESHWTWGGQAPLHRHFEGELPSSRQ